MKQYLRFVVIGLLSIPSICQNINAQTYNWIETNSPDPLATRFEDVFFLNPDTGYAVHYGHPANPSQYGYIMRTYNGGDNWQIAYDTGYCRFRDVAFTTPQHGYAGLLFHDNNPPCNYHLFETHDGGNNWQGVVLPGPFNTGICGLRAINDSTVYAIGRYNGPTSFYKTSNNGQTWSYFNIDSLADGLVDIWFFNADTGYAVGFSGTQFNNGYAVVLYTSNAGNNWQVVHTSPHVTSLGWKVVFPSRQVGYASLYFSNTSAPQYFLKTTNGGNNWQEIQIVGSAINSIEGMGFLNESIGWIGGYGGTAFTSDGGQSWTTQNWGSNLNRFRFFGDTLAYCAGAEIYKLEVGPLVTVTAQDLNLGCVMDSIAISLPSSALGNQSEGAPLSVTLLQGNATVSGDTLHLQPISVGYEEVITFLLCDSANNCDTGTITYLAAQMTNYSPPVTYSYQSVPTLGANTLCLPWVAHLDNNCVPNLFTVCITNNTNLATLSYLNDSCAIYSTIQMGLDSIHILSCGDAPLTVFTCNGAETVGTCWEEIVVVNIGCNSWPQQINASICEGESYVFNGLPVYTAGIYSDTLVNANNCDSVITLHLTLLTHTTSTLSATINLGESYSFNGTLLSQPGTYTDTLINAVGCDSVITLQLSVIDGITELRGMNKGLMVYPNPVKDELTVHNLQFKEAETMEIVDVTGRVIYQQPFITALHQLSTYSFPNGVYLVRVGDLSTRFIKQ